MKHLKISKRAKFHPILYLPLSFLSFVLCWGALLSLPSAAFSQVITGPVDMHVHFAGHLPYPLFHIGGDPRNEPLLEPNHKHQFTQTMYTEYLEKSSTVLFVNSALDQHFGQSKEAATLNILKQFNFLENYITQNGDQYALALSPSQARQEIEEGKKVFVHAIEGLGGLIQSEKDVIFWAKKGLVLATPIHLTDNELGGARLFSGIQSILNPEAVLQGILHPERKRGLTPLGKQVIGWMIKHKIMVDVTHMSAESFIDTMAIAKKYGAPVVASHATLNEVTGDGLGLTAKEVESIYQAGGFVALTSGGLYKALPGILTPQNYCPGSIDDFVIQFDFLQKALVKSNLDATKIGFATDFNGLVDHFRPKYGPYGCLNRGAGEGDYFAAQKRYFNAFDIEGLTHIGETTAFWRAISREKVNSSPLNSSAETFVKFWAKLPSL